MRSPIRLRLLQKAFTVSSTVALLLATREAYNALLAASGFAAASGLKPVLDHFAAIVEAERKLGLKTTNVVNIDEALARLVARGVVKI